MTPWQRAALLSLFDVWNRDDIIPDDELIQNIIQLYIGTTEWASFTVNAFKLLQDKIDELYDELSWIN